MAEEIREADGLAEDQGQPLPELGDPGEECPEPWDEDEEGDEK